MLLYVYAFDLLSISTSHTAVVPVRSFSMRALKIFKSCSASALPAATGAAPAAVFGAEDGAEFLDIVYSAAPTATAATTTKIPTAILLVLDCFCPCAASNIFPSFSPPTRRVRGPASPRTRERQRRRSCAGCARRQKHSPANGGTSWNSGMKGREAPRATLIAHPAGLHKRQLARRAARWVLRRLDISRAVAKPNTPAPLCAVPIWNRGANLPSVPSWKKSSRTRRARKRNNAVAAASP